ncbi:MAG: hypothetical protein ACM33B_08290 [Pseudomonadota bacterium]
MGTTARTPATNPKRSPASRGGTKNSDQSGWPSSKEKTTAYAVTTAVSNRTSA